MANEPIDYKERPTLQVGGVAKLLGCTTAHVRYLTKKNKLKATYIAESGRRYYSSEDVDKFKALWVASNRATQT